MSESKHKKYCLNCQKPSVDGHEIYDKIGQELQLPMLMEKYLHLRVESVEVAAAEKAILCKQCVNHLIELYDLAEHEKQKQRLAKISDNLNETTTYLQDERAQSPCEFEIENTIVNFDNNDVELKSPTVTFVISDGDTIDEIVLSSDNEDVKEEFDNITTEFEQNFEENEGETFNLNELNDYLDKVIVSKLEDLNFEWQQHCKSCNVSTDNFQSLLEHLVLCHNNVCTIDNCNQSQVTIKLLARHILLKHYEYDKLKVFYSCPYCEKRFSSFTAHNKHSCFRNSKVGSMQTICNICNTEFLSSKRYAFHMQFHLGVRRPKVCLICETVFSDNDEFFEHVNYRHDAVDANVCTICDRVFKNKKVLETHRMDHKNKYCYSCAFCSERFFYKFMLNQHMRKYHEDFVDRLSCGDPSSGFDNENNVGIALVDSWYCSECGLIGRGSDELAAHTSEKNTKCDGAKIMREILKDAYFCEFCSRDYHKVSDLKQHRDSGIHDDNKYTCSICQKVFMGLKNLRNHNKKHRDYGNRFASFPLRRLFVCNFEDCSVALPLWADMYMHRHRRHKPFACDTCKKKFKTKDELKQHEVSCNVLPEYRCQFCHKECPSKMSLSVHIARSHNSKNLICPHCKSIFTGSKALNDHIDFLHVEIKCRLCDKTIKNRRNMKTHMQVVHLNTHRYFCKICEKGFYYRSERETHVRTVHSSIVYKCDICGFNTNYENSMTVHKATHEENLPFKCNICERTFGRKHVLEMHIRRHSTKREFVCKNIYNRGCDASFISNYLCKKHIREKHLKLNSSSKYGKLRKFSAIKMHLEELTDDANSETAEQLADENIFLIHETTNADTESNASSSVPVALLDTDDISDLVSLK